MGRLTRGLKAIPFFRLVAFAQVALLIRRHLQDLAPKDRQRMADLVKRARHLTPAERGELRTIVGKLNLVDLARDAAKTVSPVGLPGRLGRKRR